RIEMEHYVDGFVLPIPKENLENYRKMAELASQVWMDHGALEYRECVGDDLDKDDVTTFPTLVNLKPDEAVVFAWIVFESREHRDRVNEKVMNDERLKGMCGGDAVPFDCKRMTYGGFKTIVDVAAV